MQFLIFSFSHIIGLNSFYREYRLISSFTYGGDVYITEMTSNVNKSSKSIEM